MEANGNAERIQPDPENPSYWMYQGKPVVLIGGSDEDNLFQYSDLENQLTTLAAVGGNYVRCTMSSRDEGDVWPFEKDAETGLYDLNQPSREFWRRFSHFLDRTEELGIIVQIEIWATFDYYDIERDSWKRNPFNPANNINYTPEESGLPTAVPSHPVKTENDFFRTVPAEQNNTVVLKYQHAFVDRLLEIALPHPNVLYCMDNETSVSEEWGKYWAEYVKKKAEEAGVRVETTEMWDPHDLNHEWHRRTWDHPETYSFIDVSQNNHQRGRVHYDNLRGVFRRLDEKGIRRPVTCIKTYGADTGRYGNSRDGQERFWRNLFAGCAGVRFHRPGSGLGLSDTAQRHIRSLRMVTDAVDFTRSTPANDLLSDPTGNLAYCIGSPQAGYAVFMPDGGKVSLNLSGLTQSKAVVRRLDILASEWTDERTEDTGKEIELNAPKGFQAFVILSE